MSVDPADVFVPEDAIEVVVRGILRAGWDEDRTSGEEPVIRHGWVNRTGKSPEVTVSNPEESPLAGGSTGFSGINQSGHPTQEVDGTVTVNVWADRDRTNENPRKLVFEMKNEVQRIIIANALVPTSDDYSHISYMGGRRMPPETDVKPPMWRWQILVGYGYGPAQS